MSRIYLSSDYVVRVTPFAISSQKRGYSATPLYSTELGVPFVDVLQRSALSDLMLAAGAMASHAKSKT